MRLADENFKYLHIHPLARLLFRKRKQSREENNVINFLANAKRNFQRGPRDRAAAKLEPNTAKNEKEEKEERADEKAC